MLLSDRGVDVHQSLIAGAVRLPATAEDLARRLNEVSSFAWVGGALNSPGGVSWQLVRALCDEVGTWAALLEPHGLGSVGHWVVIDGIADDGLVHVRDPAGEAYSVPLSDFAELWRYSVLVIEQVEGSHP